MEYLPRGRRIPVLPHTRPSDDELNALPVHLYCLQVRASCRWTYCASPHFDPGQLSTRSTASMPARRTS